MSVRKRYKFRKLQTFLHQKVRTSTFKESPYPCSQNVYTGQSPSALTADVFFWTAP